MVELAFTGGSLAYMLVSFLVGTAPVIFIFLMKKWGARIKAVGIYALIMALIYTIVFSLISLASGDILGLVAGGIMMFIVVAVIVFISGTVTMVLAQYVGLPFAKWLIKKFKVR
jgi:hypothetical protein